MLDEILDLFDRKRDRNAPRSGGIRGAIGRAINGDDDRREDADRRDDRRYRDDDDEYGRDPNRRRRNDAFDFD